MRLQTGMQIAIVKIGDDVYTIQCGADLVAAHVDGAAVLHIVGQILGRQIVVLTADQIRNAGKP